MSPMTPHPNDMTVWSEITCQRGHTEHTTRKITVDLAAPHRYGDYPQVPTRLQRAFTMHIYDPDLYPVDGGPYCPAHDAVSETIDSHGIWEPRETILTLHVCESARADQAMLDFGAQLGWFSLLAASCGLRVRAIDADTENLEAAWASAQANGWGAYVATWHMRVAPDTEPVDPDFLGPLRLVKIDVEGAERDAVRILWPSIEAGLVDHLLIEISPCFADYYPDLVCDLIDADYEAYLLPPKQSPPLSLDDPEHDLAPFRLDTLMRSTLRELVASWRQEDCWFKRRGASW